MSTARVRGLLAAFSGVVLLASGVGTPAADAGPGPTPQPRTQAFKIGDYSAFAVSDGVIQAPNDGKSFVVNQSVAEVAEVLKSGGAPGDHFDFEIQPLLVHAAGKVLLFDTGAGGLFGPIAGKLPQSLAATGDAPGNVTDIFISHAHGDHVGGLVTTGGNLTFPNAAIHMSAPEWQWLSGMKEEEAKNIGVTNVAKFVATIRPKVVAFQPNATLIPGVVKAVEIKGHTPGHSAYRITSGKESILYIGDSMHSYVVSVRKPQWKVMYDMDQETGAASRVALEKRVADRGQRIFAVHFPFPGVGRIVKAADDGYVWKPESLH